MTIDQLQDLCKALPAVTEDIKWEHDLVFSVGNKMFCVVGIDEVPLTASFKVPEADFDTICGREGIIPAPYMARHKWVMITGSARLSKKEWDFFIRQSYELVKNKLSNRVKAQLGLS